jgi:hypothetical protein
MALLTVLGALFVAEALRNRPRALAAQDTHAAVMSEHRF